MVYGTGLDIDGTQHAAYRRAVDQNQRFRIAMVRAHPAFVERLVRSRGYKTDAERRQEADLGYRRAIAEHRRRAKIDRVLNLLRPEVSTKIEPAKKSKPPRPNWRQIVKQVAGKHGVTFEAIIGHQRNKALVIARHEALYRLSQETTFSLVKIGHKMQRDHSSVMFGIRRHKERMEAGNV